MYNKYITKILIHFHLYILITEFHPPTNTIFPKVLQQVK